MSGKTHSEQAVVFSALGDETRLCLVRELCAGEAHSISQLTAGTRLTRQAVTKHLRVLERAKLVRCMHAGRERLFGLNPKRIDDAKAYLDAVSAQWDGALARLKALVES